MIIIRPSTFTRFQQDRVFRIQLIQASVQSKTPVRDLLVRYEINVAKERCNMEKDMLVPVSVWNRVTTENQELRKAAEDLQVLNSQLQYRLDTETKKA